MSDLATVVLKSSLVMDEQYVDLSEVVLYLVFSPIGNVASICFMKEKNVKKVFCYAYVKFTSVDEAKVALDTMNYDQIYGKSIRILWNYKDQSMNKEPKTNITVEDLDPFTAAKKLRDAVWNFNKMSKCPISSAKNKMTEYSELAPFEIGTNAANIIKLMSELRIDDWKIFAPKFQALMPFCPDISYYGIIPEMDFEVKKKNFNLYVKNFPKTYKGINFNELFKDFGTINNSIIMQTQNGDSKGFGFVSFVEENSAKNAIKHLHKKIYLEGERLPLYVAFAEKKADRVKRLKKIYENDPSIKTNIYVKNLFREISEDELEEMFKPYGEITSLILLKRDDIITVAGLINFTKHENAQCAINEINGKRMGQKLLYVTFAQTKKERQKYLNNIQIIEQQQVYNNQMNNILYQYNNPFCPIYPPLEVFIPSAQVLNLPPILAKNNKPNYYYKQEEEPLSFANCSKIIESTAQSSTNTNYEPVIDNAFLCDKSNYSNKQKEETLIFANHPEVTETKPQSSTNTNYEPVIDNAFLCDKSNYSNKQEGEPLSFANCSKIIEPTPQSSTNINTNYEPVIDNAFLCEKSNYSNKQEEEPLSFANCSKIIEPTPQSSTNINTNYEPVIDNAFLCDKSNYSNKQEEEPLSFANCSKIIEPTPQSSTNINTNYEPVIDNAFLCDKSNYSNKQEEEPLTFANHLEVTETKPQSSINSEDYKSVIDNELLCNKSNYSNKQEEEPLSFANCSKIIEPTPQSSTNINTNYEPVIDNAFLCDKSNYSNKQEEEPLTFANHLEVTETKPQSSINSEDYKSVIDNELLCNKSNSSSTQEEESLIFANRLEIIEPKVQSSINTDNYEPVINNKLLCNKSNYSNKQEEEPLSFASSPKIIEPRRQSRSTNTEDYESVINNTFLGNKSNYFYNEENERIIFANGLKIIEPRCQSRGTNTEDYESVINNTFLGNKSNYSNKEENEHVIFANGLKIIEPRRQNRWTNKENCESNVGNASFDLMKKDDHESSKRKKDIFWNQIMLRKNPNFQRLAKKVFEKVREINPKWAQEITKAMLRNEMPILNQLLSDDIKFRDEVLLFLTILED